ncbi:IclR family transcriptional regulator [Achromobacter aloeverae]
MTSEAKFSVTAAGTASPRALMRILGIFEGIAESGKGMTLADLAAYLSAPKSSLLLLLRTLVANDYLVHEAGVYRLGTNIFQLASAVLSGRDLSKLIRPFLEKLVATTGETVYLAAIDHEAQVATYVQGIDSPQAVRYSVPAGVVRPLYTSAAGKLLLAFQDPSWRDNYIKNAKLKAWTPATTIDKNVLKTELAEIRKSGVALSIGEAVEDAAGIAAPLFNSDGSVTHAILIAAPAERFKRALPALRQAILETARDASAIKAAQ